MSALTPEREALVALAAALATRDADRLEAALTHAARTAPGVAVEEVLLQSHLFVGFPAALEAMTRWAELRGGGPYAPADEDESHWAERGDRVCQQVYGANYRRLRANVASLSPDLDRWMVVGGYGRVIGRPGLDLATRELCIAALLAVWDAPRQLHSHLRGALNAGATPAEVDRALDIATDFAAPGPRRDAAALWSRIRPASEWDATGH